MRADCRGYEAAGRVKDAVRIPSGEKPRAVFRIWRKLLPSTVAQQARAMLRAICAEIRSLPERKLRDLPPMLRAVSFSRVTKSTLVAERAGNRPKNRPVASDRRIA
jgi:hypothetical protein